MKTKECKHKFEIDKDFKDGNVILLTGDVNGILSEMRYVCKKCGEVIFG